MAELGGFAESKEVIEGTEEEFKAFNWCLACDYYGAVVGEDFESLGDDLNDRIAWDDIMGRVCEWINYDGEICKELGDNIEKLYDGTIITYRNRTFIEACYEHGWNVLGNYLALKNMKVKAKTKNLNLKKIIKHKKK